jgi:hypothetical protein
VIAYLFHLLKVQLCQLGVTLFSPHKLSVGLYKLCLHLHQLLFGLYRAGHTQQTDRLHKISVSICTLICCCVLLPMAACISEHRGGKRVKSSAAHWLSSQLKTKTLIEKGREKQYTRYVVYTYSLSSDVFEPACEAPTDAASCRCTSHARETQHSLNVSTSLHESCEQRLRNCSRICARSFNCETLMHMVHAVYGCVACVCVCVQQRVSSAIL